MSQPRIYLDHAATTPILPAAKAAMTEAMERWANPSSPHAEGRAARAALEDARERIKKALGWNHHLIFTSGASEAIGIALKRGKRERCIVSAAEHDAVLRAAPDAETLAIVDGEIDRQMLADMLRSGPPPIVAIQEVNPEVGARLLYNSTDTMIAQVRDAGGIFIADCAQSAGKFEVPQADMVVVSAHKLGGPPGIGALLVRDLSLLQASGGQEQGYRGGTENLPGALGFAAAVETMAERGYYSQVAIEAMFSFKDFIWASDGEVVASEALRHVAINAIAMPGLSALAQLIRFDQLGFAVSAGSACSSGSLKPSRVLKAFGVPDEVAKRTIRVSFGWNTTAKDIHAFQEAWLLVAREAGSRAA